MIPARSAVCARHHRLVSLTRNTATLDLGYFAWYETILTGSGIQVGGLSSDVPSNGDNKQEAIREG